MMRAGSAYMSGIAAAAGLHPRSTKVLRPPFRLYGAERVLVGEQTRIGPSVGIAAKSVPPTAGPARIKPPAAGPMTANPGPARSPLNTSPPATTADPPRRAVTAQAVTETVPAVAQPSSPETATRPTLVPEEVVREEAPVPLSVLERQRPRPDESIAPIVRAEPVDRQRLPAGEDAATVTRADLTTPIEQPAPARAAHEPRALTPEPSSPIAIGPQDTPHTASPTPVRPSARQQQAPSVQIGVIDVTVLPSPAPPIPIAPQAASPAPAAASAPLSRGVGSWYGLAQR
jgi:hypothetical protein